MTIPFNSKGIALNYIDYLPEEISLNVVEKTAELWAKNSFDAAREAIEVDGNFLAEATTDDVEVTFISWEYPDNEKKFDEQGHCVRDCCLSIISLYDLLESEMEHYVGREIDRPDLERFVSTVEDIAKKLRAASGV